MNDQNRFTNEPDLARLSNAYANIRTNWPSALSELSALANQGSMMAMLYIADSYRFGIGTHVNLEEAATWLRRAMAFGSSSAAYKLGRLNSDLGNNEEAEGNLLYAASKDFTPALARLGYMYAKGVGVEPNPKKAREFLERAYGRGHLYAQRVLSGLLIRENFGISQKFRGLILAITIPTTIVRIAYRHSKLSDDASSMDFMDEELH